MIIDDIVYGKFTIKDPLVIKIIESKPMQRLKGINQYGSYMFLMPHMDTTRFEHCVGVYRLLYLLGAPREEQVAGLLHDVPHTAFSHVVDYVFGRAQDQEYHEEHHNRIITNSEIPDIIKNDFHIERLMDEKNFPLLERSIPDLCTDRLDYFMRDCLKIGILKHGNVRKIIDNLLIKDNEIMCSDRGVASMIATSFLECSLTFWSAPIQSASYQILADAIKIAMDKGVITENDLFGTDDELLEKVRAANIKEIDEKLNLLNPSFKVIEDREKYDFHSFSKARFIDPKVLENNRFVKVSDFDSDFRKKKDDFIKKLKEGYYIRIVKQ